jgi:hypothetical protein
LDLALPGFTLELVLRAVAAASYARMRRVAGTNTASSLDSPIRRARRRHVEQYFEQIRNLSARAAKKAR